MQIQKKKTVELLFSCAQGMGMEPKWLTKHLFSVVTPSGEQHVFYTKSILNSHISVILANNKFLTRTLLEHHQLPNIPFCKPANLEEAKVFLNEHGPVIAKPLHGFGARDINLIHKASDMGHLKFGKYIFEKYIVGKEMRYLILNGHVIAVHESDYGTSLSPSRELKRISYESNEWNPQLTNLTKKIAKVVNLNFAAIDFIVQTNGTIYILEVNCAPGLKWFHSPTSGPVVDVANLFLQAILEDGKPIVSPLANLEPNLI